MVTQLSPDLRPVESLVEMSIRPESLVSGDTIEFEVFGTYAGRRIDD